MGTRDSLQNANGMDCFLMFSIRKAHRLKGLRQSMETNYQPINKNPMAKINAVKERAAELAYLKGLLTV